MSIGLVALKWWRGLQPDPKQGYRGDVGTLARLRRADSLVSCLMEEKTIALAVALASETEAPPAVRGERAALIAGVLASVQDHVEVRVAAACGVKTSPDSEARKVSPLRMGRIIAARRPEDALGAFRRLVAMLGGEVNVADLAASIWDWTDLQRGDRRRSTWAFDYYGAGTTNTADVA